MLYEGCLKKQNYNCGNLNLVVHFTKSKQDIMWKCKITIVAYLNLVVHFNKDFPKLIFFLHISGLIPNSNLLTSHWSPVGGLDTEILASDWSYHFWNLFLGKIVNVASIYLSHLLSFATFNDPFHSRWIKNSNTDKYEGLSNQSKQIAAKLRVG